MTGRGHRDRTARPPLPGNGLLPRGIGEDGCGSARAPVRSPAGRRKPWPALWCGPADRPPSWSSSGRAGDRLQRRPISSAGGKRLFVKEIEEALVDGQVDLAVHSAKDLPAERLPGLHVQAVLPREDPRDAVVARRSFAHAATDPRRAVRTRPGAAGRHRQRAAGPRSSGTPGRISTSLRSAATSARGWTSWNREGFDLLVLAAAGLVRLDLCGPHRGAAAGRALRAGPRPGHRLRGVPQRRRGNARIALENRGPRTPRPPWKANARSSPPSAQTARCRSAA